MRLLRPVSPPLLAMLLYVSASCDGFLDSSVYDEIDQGRRELIARVSGEDIYRAEFEKFLSFSRGELEKDPNPSPVRELFREFLARKLLLREARREGLTVQSSEVERLRSEWTLAGHDVDPELDDYIYELLLTQKLLKRKVLSGTEVTLREMQDYFQENSDRYTVDDQARVLEILVESRDEAERIRAELAESDMRAFREKAAQASKGITSEAGGYLGVFQRGDLPEEFEKAIFALEVGQISEPFQSGHGFHLFLVEERVPAHAQRFFEVRDEIFAELMAGKEREAVNAYLDDLFRKASIEVFEREFELDYEESTADERVSQ